MLRFISVLLTVVFLITDTALAETMDDETAKASLAAAHPETAEAADYRIYPSNDAYAAWLFCLSEEPDMCNFYMSGTLWYVDNDECVKLGSGNQISSFNILRNVQPEICYCEYTAGKDDCKLQAAYADSETGTCRKLDCGNLIAIEAHEGAVLGMVQKQDYDYAILSPDIINDTFIEILPLEVSTDEIKCSEYAGDFDKLYSKLIDCWPDLEIESWYCYSADVLALNFKAGGCDRHLYIYNSSSGPVIEYDSWEEIPVAFDGFATRTQKTNFKTSRPAGFISAFEFRP